VRARRAVNIVLMALSCAIAPLSAIYSHKLANWSDPAADYCFVMYPEDIHIFYQSNNPQFSFKSEPYPLGPHLDPVFIVGIFKIEVGYGAHYWETFKLLRQCIGDYDKIGGDVVNADNLVSVKESGVWRNLYNYRYTIGFGKDGWHSPIICETVFDRKFICRSMSPVVDGYIVGQGDEYIGTLKAEEGFGSSVGAACCGITQAISGFDGSFGIITSFRHFIKLPSHSALLTKQEKGGEPGDHYRRYIKPEPITLPTITSVSFGLCCVLGSFGLVVYSMNRGDYFLPIGVLLAFLPFSLGLSMLLDSSCPEFFVGLFSNLPICRYALP
jgi:hypothetical protein